MKAEKGLADLPHCFFFLDAPQHVPLDEPWLHFIRIPPKMTHIFQPADWTKVGFKKNRKYMCLASATDALSKSSVVTSWAKTGITKAMTGVQPQHKDRKTGLLVDVPIVFDDYVLLGAEDGALDALDLFGGDESAEVVETVPVRVPPAHKRTCPCSSSSTASKNQSWTSEGCSAETRGDS